MPKQGLIHGAFGSFKELLEPSTLPRRTGAYIVDIETMGNFKPFRFATTLIPTKVKQRLETHNDSEVLAKELTHQAIVESVAVLVNDAEVLSPRQILDALNATRDVFTRPHQPVSGRPS